MLGGVKINPRLCNSQHSFYIILSTTVLKSIIVYILVFNIRYDMKRIITTPSQEKIEILKIPWYSQSPTDWKCFVCSLKMCLEYYKNEYNNSYVRQNTTSYDIEELMGITNTRETAGTIVCNSLCNVLESTKGLPFNFKLHVNYTYDKVRNKIENNLPVIVIYNGQYLKEQIAGGSHAGVVVGC